MSPPEDARSPQAHLSDSTLMELHEEVRMAVAQGIREGIRAAIEDDDLVEAYWNKGIHVAKQQARMRAGSLLLDGFTGFLKSIWKVVAGGMIVYYLGGWDLLAYYIKILFIGGPK